MSYCNQMPLTRIEKIRDARFQDDPATSSTESEDKNVLSKNQMTAVVSPITLPSGETIGADVIETPQETPSLTPASPPNILTNPPSFRVPPNPLLPPSYQEILNYNTLQYANGFYRTQIGRFVKIEQLMGSNTITDRYGYLIGVGINYILLQDNDSKNVNVIDGYNIKNMYVYYDDNPGNKPSDSTAPGR